MSDSSHGISSRCGYITDALSELKTSLVSIEGYTSTDDDADEDGIADFHRSVLVDAIRMIRSRVESTPHIEALVPRTEIKRLYEFLTGIEEIYHLHDASACLVGPPPAYVISELTALIRNFSSGEAERASLIDGPLLARNFFVPDGDHEPANEEVSEKHGIALLSSSTENHGRDHWMYQQWQAGQTYKWIRLNIKKQNAEWEAVEHNQSVRSAILRYSKKNNLPLQKRKGGAPKKN